MKRFEFASESNEMTKMEEIGLEIKAFETKLIEAQKDGDAEASTFYSEKLTELKDELAKITNEDVVSQFDKKGDLLGYSSDYYKNEMARALESGNDTAYKNAKRHWAEEKAKEETK